jgi:hypothetical protein
MPVYHTLGSPIPSPIPRASWLMNLLLLLTAYYTLLFLFLFNSERSFKLNAMENAIMTHAGR